MQRILLNKPPKEQRMKTYTVTVSVSVTRAISAGSEEELRDLILNGCTEIDDDLNYADYPIDIIDVEDE
jgi:hypothetical protein